MCIIIAKDAGVKRLNPDYFNKAWDKNPDGGGLVWKKPDEKVYFQKGFMNKERFLKKVDELNEDGTAFIAHFRIRSVGAICAANTHPFNFDHITYAHNGTLSLTPLDGKTDSETFGLKFLKDKTMDWVKGHQELLEMALGHSKFAIMDNITGEILILNKDLGKERDGAWFSNESAFPAPPTPTKTSYNNPYWYDGYDYGHGLPLARTKTKGNKTFGTKMFTQAYASLGPDKFWIYNSNNAPVWAGNFAHTVIHKRGFIIIDPRIKVPAEAVDKKYKKGAPEIILMEAYSQELFKDVKQYHKTWFAANSDRKEAEHELSAMYTMVRAMRQFVRAGKAIDDKEFLSFLLDNTEPASNAAYRGSANTYCECVRLYAEEMLARLEKAVV